MLSEKYIDAEMIIEIASNEINMEYLINNNLNLLSYTIKKYFSIYNYPNVPAGEIIPVLHSYKSILTVFIKKSSYNNIRKSMDLIFPISSNITFVELRIKYFINAFMGKDYNFHSFECIIDFLQNMAFKSSNIVKFLIDNNIKIKSDQLFKLFKIIDKEDSHIIREYICNVYKSE